MHEANDAYSIPCTWLCNWLDQFLTQRFSTRISSKFSMFHWIHLQFICLILVDVELPLCLVLALSYTAMTCFQESSHSFLSLETIRFAFRAMDHLKRRTLCTSKKVISQQI